MTHIEMKIEVEAEDFTEELSDEALDREWVHYFSTPTTTS